MKLILPRNICLNLASKRKQKKWYNLGIDWIYRVEDNRGKGNLALPEDNFDIQEIISVLRKCRTPKNDELRKFAKGMNKRLV